MTTPAANTSDQEKINHSAALLKEECLLEAARQLLAVQDKTLLGENEKQTITLAADFEQSIHDLLSEPDASDGWEKQGELHGKRNTCIHYKVDLKTSRITCRIETPIETSLLVPLVSVLNEPNLYTDWIPYWNFPMKMGVNSSYQVEQSSRSDQTIHVTCDVPWPFSMRDGMINVLAVDDIDSRNFVAVRMHTKEAGGNIPFPAEGVTRIDFDGALLFSACPIDHPILQNSTETGNDPLVLVSYKIFVDPKLAGIPASVINFVTRTVIGQIWAMLLRVAEDIRAGERPKHAAAIESRKELYEWINSRISAMISNMQVKDADPAIHDGLQQTQAVTLNA